MYYLLRKYASAGSAERSKPARTGNTEVIAPSILSLGFEQIDKITVVYTEEICYGDFRSGISFRLSTLDSIYQFSRHEVYTAFNKVFHMEST